MKTSMMCPTHNCKRKGEKRNVLGGCEDCGAQLVVWDDPSKPTVKQLAQLVASFALFEGTVLQLDPIEKILRTDPVQLKMWEQRHRKLCTDLLAPSADDATQAHLEDAKMLRDRLLARLEGMCPNVSEPQIHE